MPNSRSNIQGGKVVIPSVRTFRRMDKAADEHAAQEQSRVGPPFPGPRKGWPGNVIRVKYHTINGRPGEIIALGDSVATRAAQYTHNIAVESKTPTAGEPFAVLLTAADTINHPFALAMERGVCMARVDVTSTSHGWAGCETSNLDHLKSSSSGAAKILWKSTAGTGIQDCLIQFPVAGSGLSLHRFSANEDMGESTSGEMDVDLLELDGTDTTTDVTLKDPEDAFREIRGGDSGFMILAGDGSYYPLHAERRRRINAYHAAPGTTILGAGTKLGTPNFQDNPTSNIREPRSTDAGETIFRRSPNPTNELTDAGNYYLTAHCQVDAVTAGVAHDVQIYVTVNSVQQTRSVRRFACLQDTGETVKHPLQTEIDLVNLSALDTVDVFVQDLGSSNPVLEDWVVRVEDVRD